MSSNQSKVAETKPKATNPETENVSGPPTVPQAPQPTPDNIPAPLIDTEGVGKPKVDTGQDSKKNLEHAAPDNEPKVSSNDTTSPPSAEVKDMPKQDTKPLSGVPHPVDTILSDIVENVANKGEATPQQSGKETTRIETQNVQRVIEEKPQGIESKTAEMEATVAVPTTPEQDSIKPTLGTATKSVETEIKKPNTKSTDTKTQEIEAKSAELDTHEHSSKPQRETQDILSKPTDMETQENIPQLIQVMSQKPVDTPATLPIQELDTNPTPMETEPITNPVQMDAREPAEISQETIQKPAELMQEPTQKPAVELNPEPVESIQEPLQKPIDVVQEPIQKPVEMAQELVQKPVEMAQELVQKPVEMVQELVQKPVEMTEEPVQRPVEMAPASVQKPVETPQEPVQKSVEMAPEPVQKPVEMAPEPVQKPVEMAPASVQKPVEMAPEPVQKPVEMASEPVQKPVEMAPASVQKPVEMAPASVQKPVEMAPASVQKPVAMTEEIFQKTGEMKLEKPAEIDEAQEKTKPIGTMLPDKKAELPPPLVPAQNINAQKDSVPMSVEDPSPAKDSTGQSTGPNEPVMITSQTTAPVTIVESQTPVTETEVVMPVAPLPGYSIDDVIIVEDEEDKTQLVQAGGQVVSIVLSAQECTVHPPQLQIPNQLTGLEAPSGDSKERLLSPEQMQVDTSPLLPPPDTESMDVGQIDPTSVPLPSELIDTIVISDSPVSTLSYSTQSAEQMDVIVLNSESSPEHDSPLSPHSSTTPPSKRSKVSLSDIVSPPSPPKPTGSMSKLSADLELLEVLINSCDKLGGLTVQDQNVCYSYQHEGVSNSYTFICIEEDYPQVTLMVSSKHGNESDILSKRLPCIAWDLLVQSCAKQHVAPPPQETLTPELREIILPPLQSQISSQSNASQATNCTDEDQDYSDDSGDEDDPYDFEETEEMTMHPLLLEDVDRVKQKFNPNAIVTRNYGGIGDIDIDLIIDMNFLEPEIARAWGVKHTIPLTVRLSLSADHYLDGGDIKTEVFQEERTNTKGICKQTEKIISNFISSSTKAHKNPLCNSKVEEAVEAYRNMEQRLVQNRRQRSSKLGGVEKKGMVAQFVGKFSRDKQVDCDMLVAQLVEMGWETEIAAYALQECNMDLEKALDYLSNDRNEELDDDVNPPSFSKQQSRGAEVSGLDWMSDLSDTNEAAIKSKVAPPLSHGFLCHVIQYILNRIPTLNDFCVICDETHLFSNGAMLKPTVCARELCSFAFQTLGVMADVADSIATGPEVVELLVAMCNAASLSGRREDILDPYPTVVDPTNPKQFALHPKDKDFKKVEKAMTFVVQELKSLPAVLKERLDSLNPHSFPLLQWVLASNRCHIVKLPPERQIKSMGTTHQFLLLSAPPAKEAAFRKLKLKHNSTYAFHGSRLENWHSIMRNGLLNASGTKFQLNGAAYGSGIYLSPHASVSFGYSGIHGGGAAPATGSKKGRPTMLSSQNLNCIALCEVIDIKIKKSGNIWVLPESDHVVTRFFFVYEDNTTGDTNFDTRQDKYIKEIENSVKSLL